MYVDAACCYTPSSVVCLPVCLSQSWALQKRLNLSRCRLDFELRWAQGTICYMADTLAQSGEHDCTIRLRRRCGFISNYFDHLFTVSSSGSLFHLHCRNWFYQVCFHRKSNIFLRWPWTPTNLTWIGSSLTTVWNIYVKCHFYPKLSSEHTHTQQTNCINCATKWSVKIWLYKVISGTLKFESCNTCSYVVVCLHFW